LSRLVKIFNRNKLKMGLTKKDIHTPNRIGSWRLS
jgi:hypothetical protein